MSDEDEMWSAPMAGAHPWPGMSVGDRPFDVAALHTALRSARARAEQLPEGDARRSRLQAIGALDTALTALATSTWSPTDDEVIDEAARLISESTSVDDREFLLDRILLVTLRTARCMAAMMGSTSARPGDVEALWAEVDRLAAIHQLLDASAVRQLPDEVQQLVPTLAGIEMFLEFQHLMDRGDALADEDIDAMWQRADRYLRLMPKESADQWRAGVHLLRAMRSPDPSSAHVNAGLHTRHLEPGSEFQSVLAYPRVVAIGNDALLSGDLVALAGAIDGVQNLLADLPAGHPAVADLQGMLCQLLTRRVTVTASPQDVPLAIDAGIRSAQLAMQARGDASGISVFTVGPLANALAMAQTLDLRTGPFQQAFETLESVLGRPDTEDADVQVMLRLGSGAAGLLLWRHTHDASVRGIAQQRLEEAWRLLVARREPTEAWMRSVFQLLHLHMTTATLWNDAASARDALRVLPLLEDLLDEHPDLAGRVQAALVPGALTAAGVPDSAAGVRSVLRTMRSGLEVQAAAQPSPGDQPAHPNTRVQRDWETAAALLRNARPGQPMDLGSMLQTAASQAGVDPAQLRMMITMLRSNPDLRRQFETMLGPHAGMLDMFMQLADQMPTDASPLPSSPSPGWRTVDARPSPHGAQPSEADPLMETLAARNMVQSLLPSDGQMLTPPLQERDQLERAVTELASAVERGVKDVDVRRQARVLLALGRARLAWFAEPLDQRGLLAALKDLNVVLAADRDDRPDLRRVHLLDIRAQLRRRLRHAGTQYGAEAVDSARAALRELSRAVMASESLQERVSASAAAGPIVRRAVAWAIQDGCADQAVTVVENGRALSLAAVLLTRQLQELASASASGADTDHPTGSSAADLFADVSATADGQILLSSPSLHQLSMALTATDLDALVYLVPPVFAGNHDIARNEQLNDSSGYALILRAAHEGVSVVPLPMNAQQQARALDTWRAAQHAVGAVGNAEERERLDQGRRPALDDLGRWMYDQVIARLLVHTDSWGFDRVPHLGLVPVAEWAGLPFAAAWRPDGTVPNGRRYVVHDLVITHVPSGRALMRAAAVDLMKIDQDVVVLVDPGQSGLVYSRAFGREVTSVFPDARVLLRRAGTIQELLDALPTVGNRGASLLHLSTHGRLLPEVAIQLADGWLPLAQVLDRAGRMRPGHPGGVVVVNACVSDVMHDSAAGEELPVRFDESLTLATGLLAAGAKSVIGTRWSVPDGPAAVMAFLIHRCLAEGKPAAFAMREAQLRLIDGQNCPSLTSGPLGRIPADQLQDPLVWSAYTVQGG